MEQEDGYVRVGARLELPVADLALEPADPDEMPRASVSALVADAQATPAAPSVRDASPIVFFGVYNGEIMTIVGQEPPRRLVLVAFFDNVEVAPVSGGPATETGEVTESASTQPGAVAVMYDSDSGERIAVLIHGYGE